MHNSPFDYKRPNSHFFFSPSFLYRSSPRTSTSHFELLASHLSSILYFVGLSLPCLTSQQLLFLRISSSSNSWPSRLFCISCSNRLINMFGTYTFEQSSASRKKKNARASRRSGRITKASTKPKCTTNSGLKIGRGREPTQTKQADIVGTSLSMVCCC